MNTPFLLDQINPLRGLDARGVITQIELGQRGYYARLQWLFYFVEKRDPIVRAVKRRVLAALRGLDWNIKEADTGDDAGKKAIAEKQAETLRANYDKIENLRKALTFLALADFRGFSHLEKIYRGGSSQPQSDPWDIIELRIVEQWFWAREGSLAPWTYNQDAKETNRGDTQIDPAHFIIREVDDPADEIFAEHAVKRKVNDADWDGFLEDYGIPPMFIVMPPNVPKDREAEYQKTAEAAVSAQRGALPNGASLESPPAGSSGGASIFAERLKYIDEQIVIAGTSGQLTVLAESGSGTLAGSAQKQAFDEIAQAIADEISEVMQKQFDEPLLARLHPDEPVLAYFELSKVETEDSSTVLEDAGKAADAGFAIDEKELSEKSGYSLRYVGKPGPALTLNRPSKSAGNTNGPQSSPGIPEQIASGEVQLGGAEKKTVSPAPPAPVSPSSDPEKLNKLLASTQQMLAEANAADLVPLRRALETAIADPTPEKLQALLDQLPEIQKQLGDSSATVLQNALGAALATGLTS